MFINLIRQSSRQISCYRNVVENSSNLYKNLKYRRQPRVRTLIVSNSIRKMSHSIKSRHTNRLAAAKSPYLLQHQHNPVDWYEWSDEAIQKAQNENKMIFLSVGYSTCHWCHVMEHESFMDEEIAKIMNDNFVNIKVDREERPDIDKMYMTFLLLINGSGGWPMSVFLTPNLTPITAGTYFPPKSRWGMPGFATVLTTISERWKNDQEQLMATGSAVIEAIRKSVVERKTLEDDDETQHIYATVESKFNQAVNIYLRNYDKIWGGSAGAPKFPEMAKLNFMLHAFVQGQRNTEILDVALKQLDKMANGGIHDHVFGGFARYSVDEKWHIPHFEKMLYDQAQIMSAYVNAYKITKKQKYLRIADKIYQYVCSDLRNGKGAFYSGEDADSLPSVDAESKIEGAFYAWTFDEIKNVLQDDFEKFKEITDLDVHQIYIHHYDIKPDGNVAASSDPHGHLTGKNIPFVNGSVRETATKFGTTTQVIEKVLTLANESLNKVRSERCRPHLDTKIICAWNGLMLSGLSKLATVNDAPNKDNYLTTAKELYEFVRENLYDKETGKLFRSCYGDVHDSETTSQSEIPIFGFLDDYAFLIRGLIDYYVASLDVNVLHFAVQLQNKQNELFWDTENGGYFYTEANAPNVIVRLKEDHDGAEPCGNSVAAHNLAMLRLYFENREYKLILEKLFLFFASVKPFGYILPEMMSALLIKDAGLAMLVVIGEESEDTKALFDVGRDFFVPGMIVLHLDPKHPEKAVRKAILQFKGVGDKATAYVCEKQMCNLPNTDPEKFRKEFEKYLLPQEG
ncbi:spermatogenesis-associated protein 20 [Culicoides brevitarsis]|uniref:spermatogenesis-associated protein 20 n=1 Tax=Culicoides brevitarsis TaxID=469753 RepID=UPI00307B8F4A